MTPWLSRDVIEQLAAKGWIAVNHDGRACRFERPETCHHLSICVNTGGVKFALVMASKTRLGSRKTYDAKPRIFEGYHDGWQHALEIRSELSFLGAAGIEIRDIEVYRLSSGRGSLRGRQYVRKSHYYVGGRRAA